MTFRLISPYADNVRALGCKIVARMRNEDDNLLQEQIQDLKFNNIKVKVKGQSDNDIQLHCNSDL